MSIFDEIVACLQYYVWAALRSGLAVKEEITSWSIVPGLVLALCIGWYEIWLFRRRELLAMNRQQVLSVISQQVKPIGYGFLTFLAVMFIIAFIQDAPDQVNKLNREIARLNPPSVVVVDGSLRSQEQHPVNQYLVQFQGRYIKNGSSLEVLLRYEMFSSMFVMSTEAAFQFLQIGRQCNIRTRTIVV